MSSNAGYTQMGMAPIAGRAPAIGSCSGLSIPVSSNGVQQHGMWQHGCTAAGLVLETKPFAAATASVPDTDRTRRPRSSP